MKPSLFAEAVALFGRSAAMGHPLFTKSPPGFDPRAAAVVKAAVDAQETGDAGVIGASPELGAAVFEFLTTLTPDSALMAVYNAGLVIPTPLRVRLAAAITAINARQRTEGHPAAVTRFSLQGRLLTPQPIDALAVFSTELLKVNGFAALAQKMLQLGCGAALDGYWHGTTLDSNTSSYDASGTGATAFLADLKKLFAAVFPGGTSLARAFFVCGADVALDISLLSDTTGSLIQSSMSPSGGKIIGLPAYVSPGWPGDKLSLFDGSRLAVGIDNDTMGLSASQSATIEMNDAPTQDATQGTGSSQVSMFQTSAVAIKISMAASIERAVDSACGEITGCAYI
jgi:hypothetical protein